MKIKLIKTSIFLGAISMSSLCFAYTSSDGYEVECDGYDENGNWFACPDSSSDNDSSYYDQAKQAYENAKESLNTDSWLDD